MTADGTPTVMVVDDNEPIADTYAAFVEDSYDVVVAYNGTEALEKLDASVDVVLLDRRMPGLSGDEVLTEIRDRGLDPRVVMVTAVDPEFDIVDLPFDEYVVKPVQRGDLTAVVDEMLERSTYDDEFRRFLALASTKATLEQEKSSAELAGSEEYQRVEAQLAEQRERVGVDTDTLEAVVSGEEADIVEAGHGSSGQ